MTTRSMEKIEELYARVAKLEQMNDMSGHGEKLKKLVLQDLGAFDKRVTDTESKVEWCGTEINKLRAYRTKHTEEFTQLQAANEELKTRYDELRIRYEQVREQASTEKTRADELEQQLEHLQKEVKAIHATGLGGANELGHAYGMELQAVQEKAEAGVHAVSQRVGRLEQELKQHKATNDKLEQDLKKYKNDSEKLE